MTIRAVAPPRGARFFHFVPAKSSKVKPTSFMSGRLYCLASTESKSRWSRHVGLDHLRLHPLSDKFVKLVLQTTLPVLPAITRQPPRPSKSAYLI